MSSYIITGSADNDATAQVIFKDSYNIKCEYLSDLIKQEHPNVDIRVVIKQE